MSNDTAKVIPERTYRPYQRATLDTPLLHLMTAPCLPALQPLLSILYKIRWLLGYPLSTRIFPKCIPMPSALDVTVGELVLMLPLVVVFIFGYEASEVKFDVENSGELATLCIAYTFLTANKSNSVFSFVFGIPFERMINLHALSSAFAIALGCLHTRVAYKLHGGDSLMTYLGEDGTNLTGSIGLGAMIGLFATSLVPKLRRILFNLWLIAHILLAIATLVGLYLHEAELLAFVGGWWLLDLVIRYGVQAGCKYKVKATLRRIGQTPQDNEPALEIKFRKPCDYNPGQFVQIALPKLSIWEFHPISISSAPHEEFMTLHVRKLGDWTSRLLDLADSATGEVDIWMEGPYGNLSVDLDDDSKYKMALLVSGGIGVTPMQSIGKAILYQNQNEGRKLKYFKYVWAVRNLKIVQDIEPLGGEQDFSKKSSWFRRQSDLIKMNLAPGSSAFSLSNTGEDSEALDRRPSKASAGSVTRVRRPPAVAQVDIYCTRGKSEDEESGGSDRKYNLYSGRPDLDAIFTEFKETAIGLGEQNVAVFGCGPQKLIDDLQRMCRIHSQPVIGCGEGVFFDLHVEHFDF